MTLRGATGVDGPNRTEETIINRFMLPIILFQRSRVNNGKNTSGEIASWAPYVPVLGFL